LTMLRHTVYRHVTLIERELTDEAPVEPSEVAFQVRLLAREDIDAYCRYRPSTSPREVACRLERGSFCYVAWHGDRIISAAWYQPGEAWIEDIDRRFELPPDTVYAFDGHTAPELRGRRVAPARASIAASRLRDSGFRRGVAFVLAGNRSGHRSRVRSRWRRFGVAGYLNLGPVRVEFVRTRGRRTQWRLRRHRSRAAGRRQPPPLEPGAVLTG
jgi:hypothetical protein